MGLRELLKEEDMLPYDGASAMKDYELKRNPLGQPLTLKAIESFLTKVMEEYKPEMFTPKHYVWEENGQCFSSWEIQPGMFTGDLGYENYCKELVKQAKLYEQSTCPRSSKRTKIKSRKSKRNM